MGGGSLVQGRDAQQDKNSYSGQDTVLPKIQLMSEKYRFMRKKPNLRSTQKSRPVLAIRRLRVRGEG